jgi:starvation-inducible DNA-binding protein
MIATGRDIVKLRRGGKLLCHLASALACIKLSFFARLFAFVFALKDKHPIYLCDNPTHVGLIELLSLEIAIEGGVLIMPKRENGGRQSVLNAQPRIHQRAAEIQRYGTVSHALPIELDEPVRLEMTEQLNQMLADSMTLRDLYKKSHWQVAGPTFYQLHLLFDKHFEEQVELVDTIAERIQLLGGISLAMAHDVAETTKIERPPRGREEVPVQISRLLDAHQVIIRHCRELAERATEIGDQGTNDMVVSDILRTNELQVWFLSEHLVEMPLVHAEEPQMKKAV